MNKIVIATVVLGAATGAAAQSSLTVFGTLDTRIARGTGSIASVTKLATSGTNSSAIGLRGSEDLGGGLSASFWLEGDLNTDDGSGAATNANNQTAPAAAPAGTQGLTFARRSTLSLASTTWGELRLGRDYAPTFWNGAGADPYGNVGVGVTMMTTGQKVGPAYARASNSIGYLLPAGLAGLYGQAMHFRGENASGTPTANDGTGNSIRLGWAQGIWNFGVAAAKASYAAGDMRTTNVLARVDMTAVSLRAAYEKTVIDGAAPDSKTWLLGAIVPMGPYQFKASYSSAQTDAPGTPTSRKLALGVVYNLSKRTALYGTAAQMRNSGGAATALNLAVTGANQRSSGFDLGVRHFF